MGKRSGEASPCFPGTRARVSGGRSRASQAAQSPCLVGRRRERSRNVAEQARDATQEAAAGAGPTRESAGEATRKRARHAASETAAGNGQTVYARATTVVVKVDAATGRPMRLSAAERAAWTPYLGEPIAYAHRR